MGVGAGLYIYNVVVKKVTFAISSPDEYEFLFLLEEKITSCARDTNSKFLYM